MNSVSTAKSLGKAGRSYLLYGIFILFTIVWVYPLIWAVSSSLKTNLEMYGGAVGPLPAEFRWSYLLPSNWGALGEVFHFENYVRAWYVADFGTYFFNTVVFAVSVVAIVVVLCGMTGYVLGRYSFPGKFIFIGAVSATMVIPNGFTIIPLWKLINAMGLEDSLLGLILAEAGSVNVLYILIFMAYFAGLPKELEEAARVDGAGFLRTFFTVMLPLAMPVVATAVILDFIRAWNSFLIPLVFTASQPDLRTLAVGMYSFVGSNSTDLVGMAAGATISLVPIVVVFLFFQRYFIEGIAGAVKG